MIIERILFSPIFASPFISGILIILVFVLLFRAAWKLRLRYYRYLFLIQKNRWILLEIKLPGEIRRSPAAMEQFLMNALYWDKGDTSNMYKKYWKGEVLLTFSLEIVSLGGTIHFFIHTPAHLRDLVQTQLYAQYPQVEVVEVNDYVDRIPFRVDNSGTKIAMFSWEYGLKQPDAVPIKTYKQYGFDRAVESLDPDQQIDPMVAMIEKIAAIDPWEEIWVQFVVRAHKGKEWRADGEKIISDLIASKQKKSTDDEGSSTVFLTQGEKDYINAIEANIDQYAFEVGIRAIYLTHDASMFKVNRIGYLKNIFVSFNTQSLNSFSIANPTGRDNPWEDYNSILENHVKARALERYRMREFFGDKPVGGGTLTDMYVRLVNHYKPIKMILTSEELATIFHLPGGVYQSPSLERTDIKKAQPPANLPVA